MYLHKNGGLCIRRNVIPFAKSGINKKRIYSKVDTVKAIKELGGGVSTEEVVREYVSRTKACQ